MIVLASIPLFTFMKYIFFLTKGYFFLHYIGWCQNHTTKPLIINSIELNIYYVLLGYYSGGSIAT